MQCAILNTLSPANVCRVADSPTDEGKSHLIHMIYWQALVSIHSAPHLLLSFSEYHQKYVPHAFYKRQIKRNL